MATQTYNPLSWLDALMPEPAPVADPLEGLLTGGALPAPLSRGAAMVPPAPLPDPAFPVPESDIPGLGTAETEFGRFQPAAPQEGVIPGVNDLAGRIDNMAATMPDLGLAMPVPKGAEKKRGLNRPGAFGGTQGQNLAWLLGLSLLGGPEAASRIVGTYGRAYTGGQQEAYERADIAYKQALEAAKLEEQKRNHDLILDQKEKQRQQAYDLAMRKAQSGDLKSLIDATMAAVREYGDTPWTRGLRQGLADAMARQQALAAGAPPPPPLEGIMPDPAVAPPVPAAPQGMVPAAAAEGAPQSVMYGPGGMAAQRAAQTQNTAANTQRTLAQIPGEIADSYVKQQTATDKVAQAELDTILGRKKIDDQIVTTAGKRQAIGQSAKLFPGKLTAQEKANQKADLENWILRYQTVPMNAARLEHQNQVNTGTTPTSDAAVPTGANAAIASNAAAWEGADFRRFGCARFVTQTLKDAGVGIAGSQNAGELEGQIKRVKGVSVESDPAKFKPGDIIFMPGSGPSGRHVMVVDKNGRIMGVPGGKKGTTVQVQQGGPGMVAYRLPEGTADGKSAAGAKASGAGKASGKSPLYEGISSTMAQRLAGLGVSSSVPGAVAQDWYARWRRKGDNLFKRRPTPEGDDSGSLTDELDPDSPSYTSAMDELNRLNARYAPKRAVKRVDTKTYKSGSGNADALFR